MLKNFSPPMSAPKPASVRTKPSLPTSLRPILSAIIEEFPWAMFAKGPACTRAGVPSTVWKVLGWSASIISTVSAPVMPKSSAVRGSPFFEKQQIILPRRARRSFKSVARARIAMISELTVIAKEDSRLNCLSSLFENSLGLRPISTFRKYLSLQSVTRRHVMVSGSMSNTQKRWISSGVRRFGSCFLWANPSFSSLAYMDGSKLRFPALSAGHSLLKMPSALDEFSW
mmetsp:Transcript_59553/g.159574  ORF Transcript_59553/g.159574 Transcript_59553/m.159574 type:complete len:228 (-) Transcript_59553:672-1355(-)